MFQNVSNVISPFAERWFSVIYKGAKNTLWRSPNYGPGDCCAWVRSLFYKSSLPCPAAIISPSETTALFPIIWKGIPQHSKNRPACYDTHIGPEENYIWDVSKRLKCNFALLRALIFNALQRRFLAHFRGEYYSLAWEENSEQSSEQNTKAKHKAKHLCETPQQNSE